jgi:hypothetical protein
VTASAPQPNPRTKGDQVTVNQQQTPEGAGGSTGGGEEVLPSFPEQVAAQLGGWRGMVEAAIPIAVFIVANVVWALEPALLISIGVAVAIAAVRLAQRRPVRYAVNGLFGIGIGAVLAWRSGEARDFYLPGIVVSYFYVVLMIGSVLIRHPLVGWLWAVMFAGGRSQWRQDPVLMRTLTWLTLAWAAVWVTKVTAQLVLYLADLEHALGVARIVLGAPVFALMLAITIWIVGRVQQQHPVQA